MRARKTLVISRAPQVAGPLYTRTGCHLCEEAKALIEPILREFGVALREVDIDEDAALQQRYGTDIPVIFIGGRKAGSTVSTP